MAHFADMEDVELEAAPLEASLEDLEASLDDICPTDREIAEVEAGAGTVLEQRPLTWSWSGVKDALVRGVHRCKSSFVAHQQFWSNTHTCVCAAWDVADTHLANLFGLNESKYEWAVREYYYQKRMEAEEITQVVQQQRSQVRNTEQKLSFG